jgi:GT2 family glycosyltransferase
MIKREVFDKIGYLDEIFAAGSSEDIDFCIKAEDAGYELAVAGEMTGHSPSEGQIIGSVPIYHKGEATVNDTSLIPNWGLTYERNIKILYDRYCKKVSIVIGTLNHLDDLLKPCCESIIKYCNLDDKEIIIVANGCTDGTREYVESLGKPFKLLWFDSPLGFPKAYNEGIKIAVGEYILLLNNDTFLLEQEKDALINIHIEQFEKNSKVGIVGPLKNLSPCVEREFIVFFCAMIKRELFEKIGLLDEGFLEGQGEDTDFCIRAEEEGYEMAVAGYYAGRTPDGSTNSGSVPIYHKGEGTLHDDPNHLANVVRNTKFLVDKYSKKAGRVLCAIPTKGRYLTTLPLAIASVISQTVKPDMLVIYDDGEHKDLREIPIYQYFFKTLDDVGIKWQVAFTAGVGQHHAHQRANTSDYKFVWRLDDDTIAMPDVLEKLLSHMKEGVGAVAGSVITPGGEAKSDKYGIKLLDVNRLPNIQWAKGEGVVEVEHLYSSFLYRTNIVDYCMELSTVAHREETIFSHRLFQAGYKLLVDRSAVTYHYRNPEGGIRTEKDPKLWEHDEEIFRAELQKWGYKMIALSHGLGDHLMFANIIPELLKRCKTLVLFCVFGEVFEGFENIVLRPVGEAASFGIKENGVYEWMTKYNWKRSMLKAYEELYLN